MLQEAVKLNIDLLESADKNQVVNLLIIDHSDHTNVMGQGTLQVAIDELCNQFGYEDEIDLHGLSKEEFLQDVYVDELLDSTFEIFLA